MAIIYFCPTYQTITKMKKTILTFAATCAIAGSAMAQLDSVTFVSPGVDTFYVPPCVTSITIKAFGAQGAAGNGSAGGAGGLGAYVSGNIPVTPGQILLIEVGGAASGAAGGLNGGGNGGNGVTGGSGGGGGGYTMVSDASTTAMLALAGGGGGGGGTGCMTGVAGGAGGAGGGGNGVNGTDSPTINGVAGGGFGAVGSAFGAKGIGCAGFLGNDGTAGASFLGGNGGAGQTCCCSSNHTDPSGGGGGGGLVGGGGGGAGSAGTTACSGNDKGAGGGGAGGTNFTGTMTNVVSVNGVHAGDGMVTLVYNNPAVSISSTMPANFCAADGAYNLTDGVPAGGVWTGTGVLGNTFNPTLAGVGTYVLTYTNCGGNTAQTTVVVNPCVGITENGHLSNAVAVYPNPVNEKLTIETTATFGASFVVVYDANGSRVYESELNGEIRTSIDASKWAKGNYKIQITGAKGKVTKNVVK